MFRNKERKLLTDNAGQGYTKSIETKKKESKMDTVIDLAVITVANTIGFTILWLVAV